MLSLIALGAKVQLAKLAPIRKHLPVVPEVLNDGLIQFSEYIHKSGQELNNFLQKFEKQWSGINRNDLVSL